MPRNLERPHRNTQAAVKRYLQQFEGTNLWIKVGIKYSWNCCYINILEINGTYVEAYALDTEYVELPLGHSIEDDYIGLDIQEFIESGCEFYSYGYSLDEIILLDDCYCITTEEILENIEHFINGLS